MVLGLAFAIFRAIAIARSGAWLPIYSRFLLLDVVSRADGARVPALVAVRRAYIAVYDAAISPGEAQAK